MLRFIALVFFVLLCSVGHLRADEPAPTLNTVIAKYRADVLLDSGSNTDASPLFMTLAERRLAFAHFDALYPTRTVQANGSGVPLPEALIDLTQIPFTANDNDLMLGDLLQSEHLLGLIVVKNGDVLMEHYAPDHAKDSRWVTFSVTKSVTSLLIGAAIQDGYIDSADDPIVKYLPRLAGTEYGKSRVRDILHMASGIAWNEDYQDPESDVARAGALNGVELTDYLGRLPRVAEPGARFNYNTAESNLLGEILRSAIGMNAAPYLSQKIWQPMGMEYDANWLLSLPQDRETGGCCISAALRDYARLGLFALADGVLPSGARVVPEGWIAASTTPSQGYEGYGYKWWLYGDQRFGARGVFGQAIFVDAKANLVIAAHGNGQIASGSDHNRELDAALLAISDFLRSL
ncbi:MAG: serine hydrolase [Luminiphilus sp.]|jgi:CubicO group peptidase (beta-lactamase class C family)|nr:serine hydrolase [Luminiphilus sp.]